ncbi:hypothetical protein [Bifidobacterium apri]|uniref:Uncharacterized protein n=1 Tax=Bifidobacterium apri TaxID=1769423 RepID=A0A6A2VG59_9BIFI|nr:hypothetical protein [Bifidobacterium apri]KAB8292703.1 hypothetical protein DSM100238_1788 [Bifidobacterium apri]
MKAISGFSYEEVNPSTCADYVREYVSNSDAVENPEAEFDLDKAGEMLYEYMCAHSAEIIEAYLDSDGRTPVFDFVDGDDFTDIVMACALPLDDQKAEA